jgi:hypothetical protein
MTEDELQFLSEVSRRSKDKAMMQSIIMCAINGLELSAIEAHLRASDMEVVANMALNNKLFKGNEHFIAHKLEQWQGKTSIKWDSQIAKLKEKNHA